MSKYTRMIGTEEIDVYEVLEAYDVRCSATQHAIKKLLLPGGRGSKGILKDLTEASESVTRAIELQMERDKMGADSSSPVAAYRQEKGLTHVR